MYNEEFKRRYLGDNDYRNTNIVNYMTVQFRKTEAVERLYGKDVYDFTTKEIVDFYKMLCSTSLETLMVLNNQLAIYTRYALANNVVRDCQNHYEEIDNEVLSNCTNNGLFDKNIFTREQIVNMSKSFENACEPYIVLAFFEGICGEKFSDITNLTPDNYVGNKVYLPSGKVFEVSSELIAAMEESADEYRYFAYTKSGDIKETKFKEGDRKIIKEMYNTYRSGATQDRVRVYNRLTKISTMYNLPGLTSKALMESGRIDMICRFMREDNTSDVRSVIKKHMSEIEYRYGKISSVARYLVKYERYISA